MKPQLGTLRREHGVADEEQTYKGNREKFTEKQEVGKSCHINVLQPDKKRRFHSKGP